jgi:hypothetical protein
MLGSLITAIWFVLMALAIGLPAIVRSPTAAADQVVLTIRIALVFYFAAAALMLRQSDDAWRAGAMPVRTARLLWSLGWLAYAIHVSLAFQHYHDWSHSQAMAHVRDVSGVGEGIFVSYFFTLLWCLDVLAWWIWPRAYVRRPAWIGWAIQGFMAFIVFNGAVIYAPAAVRWVSAAVFLALAGLLTARLWRPRDIAKTERVAA